MKGWTAETLKQCEDVERDQFGTGRLEARIDRERLLADEDIRRRAIVAGGEVSSTSLHRGKRIRDKFIASSSLLANIVSTWVDYFKSILVELLDDDCFRVGSQIGRKLLGIPEQELVGDDDIATTLTQARVDEEEYSQEWIDEMEKMMAAYDKKKTITTSFTRPSFVLDGFECPDPFATQQTQEADDSGGGVVAPQPDGRAVFAPAVDQPGIEEHQGGSAMPDPVGDVAGLEVPTEVHTSDAASDMVVVGGLSSKARVSVKNLNTFTVTCFLLFGFVLIVGFIMQETGAIG